MVLVICPLIGLTEDQIKEGQLISLTCALLQDVNDLFTTLLVATILVAMATRILELVTNLNRRSPLQRLKSTG